MAGPTKTPGPEDIYTGGGDTTKTPPAGTPTAPNKLTSIVGQIIVAPDGTQLQVAYDQTPEGKVSLVLVDPNNPGGKAIPFPGAGEYWTATHQRFVVDARGGLLAQPDNISESEWQGAFGKYNAGQGTGSTHIPQPYGFTAPDPLGAANALLQKYAYQIQASNGAFDAEKAFADFQKEWAQLESQVATNQAQLQQNTNELNASQNRAENADIAQRQITEAQRRVDVANEAGRRAATVARDILPYSIPGATSMNLPLLGNIPLNQVNLGQLFNQGGPGNLSTLPSISPTPANPYQQYQAPQIPGLGPMPNFPAPPQYPTMPTGIDALIAAGAAGSGPMGWA